MFNKISLKNFKEKLFETEKKSVVYFHIPGCCPCKVIEPHLIDFEKKYRESLVFYDYSPKFDTIKEDPIVTHFNCLPMPQLIFIHKDKIVDRLIGEFSRSALEKRIEKFLQM